jgi:hypothetical protein
VVLVVIDVVTLPPLLVVAGSLAASPQKWMEGEAGGNNVSFHSG